MDSRSRLKNLEIYYFLTIISVLLFHPFIMNFLTPNPDLLESKLSRFTPETTRVVTDFDSTLTSDNEKTSW